MTEQPNGMWDIDPTEYPKSGSASDKLRFLVRYAVLAPSSHNTQPWLFRVGDDSVEIFADRRRSLPVVDPDDRELVISCGAAVGVLQAAMRRFGQAGEVELLADPDDPDLLARVSLGTPHTVDAGDQARFDAITRRRSTRTKFENNPLPSDLSEQLRVLALEGGVELSLTVESDEKAAIAALIAEADRIQYANPSFRRELAAWIHSRRADSRDGMSLASFGAPDILSRLSALLIRGLDLGNQVASTDEQNAASSPAIAVVATEDDTPYDWLTVGMAHVQLLLSIAAAELTSAYLSQPVEISKLRTRFRATAGTSGVPQLLLRFGAGPEIPPSSRRKIDEVLIS